MIKKLIVLTLVIVSCIFNVKANQSISIDLDDSSLKLSETYVEYEVVPDDEINLTLEWKNKTKIKQLLYLEVDCDEKKLLEAINVSLYYDNIVLYDGIAKNISIDDCLGNFDPNEKKNFYLHIKFDKNANNQYTMLSANIYLKFKTVAEQENIKTGIDNYSVLIRGGIFGFSIIGLILLLKKGDQYAPKERRRIN